MAIEIELVGPFAPITIAHGPSPNPQQSQAASKHQHNLSLNSVKNLVVHECRIGFVRRIPLHARWAQRIASSPVNLRLTTMPNATSNATNQYHLRVQKDMRSIVCIHVRRLYLAY